MILCIAIFLFAYMLILCCCCCCFVAVVAAAAVFLENKCKSVAYNWLQISCINTLPLINPNFNSFLICDQL